jgi:hypothetical protein
MIKIRKITFLFLPKFKKCDQLINKEVFIYLFIHLFNFLNKQNEADQPASCFDFVTDCSEWRHLSLVHITRNPTLDAETPLCQGGFRLYPDW